MNWTPELGSFTGPKYQAIADMLSEAIKGGELKSGDRLPPQRELAAHLGFDLTTITRGYDIARQRGLIIGRGRAGSFVRNTAKASIAAALQVDTGMNTPPVPQGAVLQMAISNALRSALARGDATEMQYQSIGGAIEHRRAGSFLLERIGLRTEPDQTVVTAGGQNALHAILSSIASPGDRVACGCFVYPGFNSIASRMGLQLVPLASMTADALLKATAQGPVKALYVVPTNDNPTAATVPTDERSALAEAARLHGIQIVEDDAYGLLATEQLAPIAKFAPELAWYVLSTSKIISPTLRVAFVKAPSVGQAIQLATDVHETAVMAPPMNAGIVTEWLGDGTFDRLVAAVRSEAVWRMKLATKILHDQSITGHPQGYHFWVELPKGVLASQLSHTLAAVGIGAIPSDRFAVGESSTQALRVSLGGAAAVDTLETALRSLEGHLSTSQRLRETVI